MTHNYFTQGDNINDPKILKQLLENSSQELAVKLQSLPIYDSEQIDFKDLEDRIMAAIAREMGVNLDKLSDAILNGEPVPSMRVRGILHDEIVLDPFDLELPTKPDQVLVGVAGSSTPLGMASIALTNLGDSMRRTGKIVDHVPSQCQLEIKPPSDLHARMLKILKEMDESPYDDSFLRMPDPLPKMYGSDDINDTPRDPDTERRSKNRAKRKKKAKTKRKGGRRG